MTHDAAAADSEPSAPVALLLENHRAFLRYLERKVGDRAIAEDILQDAFAKVVATPEKAPTDEAIVPWFYRTLRSGPTPSRRACPRATPPCGSSGLAKP